MQIPRHRSRRVVECVEAYVRAHLDTRVPISSLSRLTGLSERGLRNAFYDVHGVSPTRWMVAERLRWARRALSEDQTGSITVTCVATDFGFNELGRFAASYRHAFGEAPSETLRIAHRAPPAHTKGYVNV
jgi:AraC-like DNA-binding protein